MGSLEPHRGKRAGQGSPSQVRGLRYPRGGRGGGIEADNRSAGNQLCPISLCDRGHQPPSTSASFSAKGGSDDYRATLQTGKAVFASFCLLANCLTSLTPSFFLCRYNDPHDNELWGKYDNSWASLIAQLVKNQPAMQETQVLFLGREDPLEKGLSIHSRASLMAQLVKNSPAMRETWVRSLGWEDPLEKGKATHSSVLA